MNTIKKLIKKIGNLINPKKIPQQERLPGRCYQVPSGLVPLVLKMTDIIENDHLENKSSDFNRNRLWRLLRARCPETRTGAWRLIYNPDRDSARVEEVQK